MYFCKCARTVPHGPYGAIFPWKLTFKVKIICSEYFCGNFKQFQSTLVGRLEKMPKGQIDHSESIWNKILEKLQNSQNWQF